MRRYHQRTGESPFVLQQAFSNLFLIGRALIIQSPGLESWPKNVPITTPDNSAALYETRLPEEGNVKEANDHEPGWPK